MTRVWVFLYITVIWSSIEQNEISNSETEILVKNSESTIISKLPDVDEDSITTYDNCPWDENSDQADLDNDGHGDLCDNDDDSDRQMMKAKTTA